MTNASTPHPAIPAALGWRLLAMLYDMMPVIAIWIAVSAITLAVLPGHQPLAPWSTGQLLLWVACWLLTGAYAIGSWRQGGQTLGMRPWRLKVVCPDGSPPRTSALCLRYAVATLSLLAVGLGFLWSVFDHERRSWHDLASGTVLVRLSR